MTENRYQIITKPAQHCIGPKDENGKPRLEATLVGRLTEDEFREEFGPGMRITRMMCHETDDIDGYTIHVLLAHVPACGINNSHQHILVNGMLKAAGQDPLEHAEISRRGRSYEDIAPDAAAFLMGCAEGGMAPGECYPDELASLAASEGFTLHDFLRPEDDQERD